MTQAYHNPPNDDDEHDPRLAIRRATDRCFHRVEEVVPGGYIVDGFMIDEDEVVETVKLDADGAPLPACRPTQEVKSTSKTERQAEE